MRAIIAKDVIAVRRSKADRDPDARRAGAADDRAARSSSGSPPGARADVEHQPASSSNMPGRPRRARSSTCPPTSSSIVLVQRLPAGAAVPHRAADGVGGARRRRLRRREGAQDPRVAAPPARSPTASSSTPSCSPPSSPPWPCRGSGFVVLLPSWRTRVAWPVLHRVFVPDPAVARDDPLGRARRSPRSASAVMVRVSARARTSQEANQLGGAVILPLIFLAVGQSSGLLLVPLPVAIAVGAVDLGRRPLARPRRRQALHQRPARRRLSRRPQVSLRRRTRRRSGRRRSAGSRGSEHEEELEQRRRRGSARAGWPRTMRGAGSHRRRALRR